VLERSAVNRERIDWPALRAEAAAVAARAQTTADTYPAIEMALGRLDDRHSFLRRPERVAESQRGINTGLGFTAAHPEGVVTLVFPDSAAERAGMRARDSIEAIDGAALATFDEARFTAAIDGARAELALRRPDGERFVVAVEAAPHPVELLPEGRRLDDIGYLELPIHLSSEDEAQYQAAGERYAIAGHALLRQLDSRAERGWILDLRRNRGGNMWPMLVATGPLIGEGECCGFVSSAFTNRISYRDGAIFQDEQELARIAEPYRPARQPRVAVLTSRYTGSAGEFVALAFRGHPTARSFGTPTGGVPTGNQTERLPDGALIYLTVCHGADRTGQSYAEPLPPDVPVAQEWAAFGTERDPVIAAARAWLMTDQAARGGSRSS
jgi:carboxyl-terminal processing protease